jgi:hypothetical protein
VTADGKRMPLEPPERRLVKRGERDDGTPIVETDVCYLSHFAVCPDAARWRRH